MIELGSTPPYIEKLSKVKDLMGFCRSMGIPVFYTEAVKEDSGIVIMTNVHNILPKSRQERLKYPFVLEVSGME